MIAAERAQEILPEIFRWSVFSPAHRVELSSCAVRGARGWWVFDPLPLVGAVSSVVEGNSMAGIILTNENHERDSAAWSSRFQAEIWAAPESRLLPHFIQRWPLAATRLEEWQLISLPGGASGETAFYLPNRSLLILGDAIVNLPGRGLEILPDKYCQDSRLLRESLRQLPHCEHALFAHGDPLIDRAAERLALLGIYR